MYFYYLSKIKQKFFEEKIKWEKEIFYKFPSVLEERKSKTILPSEEEEIQKSLEA